MSLNQDEATARTHHVFTETVAAARSLDDPLTVENEGFWQIASNIIANAHGGGYEAMYDGPEMAELVTLAKAITVTSRYSDWASAWAICDRQFDELDGGEELGLSDAWYGVDFDDARQREAALRHGMQFHRVPKGYQLAIAEMVTKFMLAMPRAWHCDDVQLRQPWAQYCTYVVFAIAERVKAVSGMKGLGRFGHGVGFH